MLLLVCADCDAIFETIEEAFEHQQSTPDDHGGFDIDNTAATTVLDLEI